MGPRINSTLFGIGVFATGLAAGVKLSEYVSEDVPSLTANNTRVSSGSDHNYLRSGNAFPNPYTHPRRECQILMDRRAEIATRRVPVCPVNRITFDPICSKEYEKKWDDLRGSLSAETYNAEVKIREIGCDHVPGYKAFDLYLNCLTYNPKPASCPRVFSERDL